ncbi:MAG: NAD(P)/FAD-dependent oxidoreductase, partial [Verrucomicrobia bacterium]|nr:NAD(P)/FAD-dependent oxidoreductase [Verrucomicrobiota bacterium]
MQTFDVAIVGGGPAGSSCAAFCAMADLETLILERARFPREKVCGDCLNPSCWPVLERLGLAQRVLSLPHSKLTSVDFIAIDGRKVSINLPTGNDCELSVKRSLFDDLLFKRARELGAQGREDTTVTALVHDQGWKIETATRESFRARVLIGADGRNSTVARLRNLLPRLARERVALQAHIPLPLNFDERVVLQFLREGYSGQAPVNENELNLCLVGKPSTIPKLRQWAQRRFEIPANQRWRTITPLT